MGEVRFGSSPDFSKDRKIGSRLKEQFEKRFTFNAAKKEWLDKHKARVENLQRIEGQLAPEQRQKVVDKLNRDANIGAAWTIGKNVLGVTGLFGAILLGGRMTVDAAFRGKIVEGAKRLKNINLKDTFRSAWERAEQTASQARRRATELAEELRERGKAAVENMRTKAKPT